MSDQSNFDPYTMTTDEHIKEAERLAKISADINIRDSGTAQAYATLAVAHAQIAQAQLVRMRSLL